MRAEVAKGGKERDVPVPKKAREVFTAYMKERVAEGSSALFIGRQGALTAEGVAAVVAKCCLVEIRRGDTSYSAAHLCIQLPGKQ